MPIEQQGGLLNSDALQAALTAIFAGTGTPIPDLSLLLQYSGYDEVIQPMVAGGADNAPIMNSFLNPTVGQIIQAGNIRARIKYAGNYTINSLIDVDPQVSMALDARGGIVLIPGANLPGVVPGTPGTGVRTGGGGPAALFRIVRRAPDINKQAYEAKWGGFNVDATGVHFANTVSCFRIPTPDPSKNANDPDQNFLTNKKYTGCAFFDMDLVGFSGDQITIGTGNGRTSYMNFRALNGSANGITDQNNDIVMFGHSAVGGNGSADANGMGQGYGVQWGTAAGVFITTGNFWDVASIRSANCAAMFFNARKMYGMAVSEFNGWCKVDGGAIGNPGGSFWRGGSFIGVVMAQFGACYVSDGIMIDTTFPSPDSRLQSNMGFTQVQSHTNNLNVNVRSDSVGNQGAFTVAGSVLTSNNHGLANNNIVSLFVIGAGSLPTPLTTLTQYYVVNKTTNTFQVAATPSGSPIALAGGSGTFWYSTFPVPFNAGGDPTGTFGSAPQYWYDIGGTSMINCVDATCSAPNVRSYQGTITSFTVTIAAPGVFTFGAAVVPQNGHRIVLSTTGVLPGGITWGTVYYVVNAAGQTCNLALTYNGAPITTTGSQSGTHSLADQSQLPYNVHSSSQCNYILMDAYWNLTRIGGQGNGQHSHTLLGINEADDFNPNYAVEIGDRSIAATLPWRNAAYGMWEFNNAVQYQDTAYDARVATNGGTRNIAAGVPFQFLSVAGGGIATYTINFPTDQNASSEGTLYLTGGAITALTFGITGSGSFNTNAGIAPTFSPGTMTIRWAYRRDTNQIYINTITVGDKSNVIGRVDGTNPQAGSVGEFFQSTVLQGSAVNIAVSGTTIDVTSITLTPGNYRIDWSCKIRGNGATCTQVSAGVNTSSVTIVSSNPSQSADETVAFTAQTGNLKTLSGGCYILKVTVSTQVFLSAVATFTVGTMSAFGSITAVRIS
jgi:hypothetical protein